VAELVQYREGDLIMGHGEVPTAVLIIFRGAVDVARQASQRGLRERSTDLMLIS
jgi:hypothetical protein